jgi:hypothetical protein
MTAWLNPPAESRSFPCRFRFRSRSSPRSTCGARSPLGPPRARRQQGRVAAADLGPRELPESVGGVELALGRSTQLVHDTGNSWIARLQVEHQVMLGMPQDAPGREFDFGIAAAYALRLMLELTGLNTVREPPRARPAHSANYD